MRPLLLDVAGLNTGYAKKQVLYDVDIHVEQGEVVVVLGHNGAGKTTLVKAIFGRLPLYSGAIRFMGHRVDGSNGAKRVELGVTYTPAEAAVFRDLTIRDNLELGAFTVRDRKIKNERLEKVFDLFPILKEREKNLAGSLSGGQQRMLSLSLAVMAGPKLMLLDEPSLGLAPAVVQEIFEQIKEFVAKDGVAVVLVEQNVRAALRIARRAYFMRAGRIILEESGEQALERGHWWDLF